MSIVIPTRNGARHIAEMLQAIADERPGFVFEVVVSDNGSTDATLDVVARFREVLDISVVDSSAHPGRAGACNVGARASRAQKILFLDDDDVIQPGYLAAMREALDSSDLVGARIDVSTLNRGWRSETRSIAQSTQLPAGPAQFVYGATMGVTRSAFDRVGGFDASMKGAGEDVDFCLRLRRLGVHPVYVTDAVLRYRFRDTRRALFKQGYRYGRHGRDVDARHPEFASTFELGGWLRRVLRLAVLVFLAPRRGLRWRALFELGRAYGTLVSRLRGVCGPGALDA